MPRLGSPRRAIWAAISVLMMTSPLILVPASAQCTREGLLAAAASYVAAQASGSTAGLALAASNFTYQENNRAADITRGVLAQALAIDLNRTTADTTACASYTVLVAAGTATGAGARPYVIGTQLRHAGNDTSVIAAVDTIAATTGSLFFDARQTLTYLRAEDWGALPAGSAPADRAALRAVGDAYLDMWTDAGAADRIPWGTDCERVEGSRLTRPCGGMLPRGGSARPNGNRRYVIDETVGSVDVLCSFDSLGDMPDSHEIRVVDGKVKYVHTITVIR